METFQLGFVMAKSERYCDRIRDVVAAKLKTFPLTFVMAKSERSSWLNKRIFDLPSFWLNRRLHHGRMKWSPQPN